MEHLGMRIAEKTISELGRHGEVVEQGALSRGCRPAPAIGRWGHQRWALFGAPRSVLGRHSDEQAPPDEAHRVVLDR